MASEGREAGTGETAAVRLIYVRMAPRSTTGKVMMGCDGGDKKHCMEGRDKSDRAYGTLKFATI